MVNPELITCSRCHVPKPIEAYWFDKRRNKVRKPCRDCCNKKNNLRERLRNANSVIMRHDVKNHYGAKGLPDDIVDFFSDLIILNRGIKKMQKPIIKADGLKIHLFCPVCGDFESVELPCGAEPFLKILTIFTEIHNNHDL